MAHAEDVAEIVRLRDEVETLRQQLADMQSHRDAWREYAYGKREKPQDFLDGNKVDRGPTEVGSLRTALEHVLTCDWREVCSVCGAARKLLEGAE